MFYELALFFKGRLPFFVYYKNPKRLAFVVALNRTFEWCLDYCLEGWAEHKTWLAMREVDKQSKAIREIWEAEDSQSFKPVYYETENGGMGVKAPWAE
ncbi:hypothetical protein PSS2_gp055 [Cyanophage PSS2]|uniref:hypothetical protein n=1 Tax=Cyanophage PSS2 TaxID=658401 RepID=UPI0001B0400C|nr:hypothetical protein PSS2_gp055 [Cyanophage PSS2]ACT65617.1 hypothetical protein [Cyanophage PSS2]